VWHKAVWVIFIRTSPFCGGETMTSQISRGWFGAVAMAALHVNSSDDVIFIARALFFALPIDRSMVK
jgi:hypothetical protein